MLYKAGALGACVATVTPSAELCAMFVKGIEAACFPSWTFTENVDVYSCGSVERTQRHAEATAWSRLRLRERLRVEYVTQPERNTREALPLLTPGAVTCVTPYQTQ